MEEKGISWAGEVAIGNEIIIMIPVVHGLKTSRVPSISTALLFCLHDYRQHILMSRNNETGIGRQVLPIALYPMKRADEASIVLMHFARRPTTNER